MVFDLVEDESNVVSGRATKILVMALAERGAFDEAHEVLEVLGLAGSLGTSFREVSVRHGRAHLALAEGDYEAALAEALEVGDLREDQGRPGPSLDELALARRPRVVAPRSPRRGGRTRRRGAGAGPELRLAHHDRRGDARPRGCRGRRRRARRAVRARARPRCDDRSGARNRPSAARARQHARLHGQPRRGARGAAPGARRRRRRGRGAARRARAARARRDRPAPAPGGDRGRRPR